MACELAAGYGLVADDWQEDVLIDWMPRLESGRWASATCWLAIPRQNGKNACIEIRELYGMVELGERFLHTAHEVKTARKAFRRLLSFFDNPRKYPELHAMCKEIRKTNGQEAIFLDNGGSFELIARSNSSGRGFDGIDVLVIDEAQELTDDEQAALLPTISAATQGNPQVIFTGTPPDPLKPVHGEVFRRVRQNAMANNDPRLCAHDFGVADGPLPDTSNVETWHAVNPALGGRLGIEEVEREHGLMSPEKFAAERLGWWGDPDALKVGQLITPKMWADLEDTESTFTDPVSFGVYLSLDRSMAAIVAAGRREDGKFHVEVLPAIKGGDKETVAGTGWIVPRVVDLCEDWSPCAVVIDGYSAAASLIPTLEEAGVEITVTNAGDMAKACGNFYDAVLESNLRHLGSPALARAATTARTRILSDAWAWDRRDPKSDITQLVSATLALHGLIVNGQQPQETEVWGFYE